MENVSRSKLLLCFRPVFGMELETVIHSKAPLSSPTTTLATYFHWENQKIKASRTTPSCPNCRSSQDSNGACSMISRPHKRTLSRAVKAIVSGTIPIKSVREKKGHHQQKSCPWKRSLSLNSEGFRRKEDDEFAARPAFLCTLSSGSSSSSSFQLQKSKSMNSSTSISVDANKAKEIRGATAVKRRTADRSCYAFNSGIGALVISHVITVIWGRLYAVFFASFWLYFFAWMHAENRWRKQKKTKFPEKELTENSTKNGCRNRRGGKKEEDPEKGGNKSLT